MTDQEGLVFEIGGRRYVDGEVIGRGGLVTIYNAVDIETGEVVIVKAYRRDLRNYKRALENSVRAHDMLRQGSGLFPKIRSRSDDSYVMDYVDGVNLGRFEVPKTEIVVLTIGFDVAMCLSDLHENYRNPIIHRDVKPGNIILSYNGVSVLVDLDFVFIDDLSGFGINEPVGTSTFFSPEQFYREPVKPESDIFSLGSTMYNLFTGRKLRKPIEEEIMATLASMDQGNVREVIANCWRRGQEYNAFYLAADISERLKRSGTDIDKSHDVLAALVKKPNLLF